MSVIFLLFRIGFFNDRRPLFKHNLKSFIKGKIQLFLQFVGDTFLQLAVQDKFLLFRVVFQIAGFFAHQRVPFFLVWSFSHISISPFCIEAIGAGAPKPDPENNSKPL